MDADTEIGGTRNTFRIKWSSSNEDAKDLTQEFFAVAFEKAFFEYLRTRVDGLVNRRAGGK